MSRKGGQGEVGGVTRRVLCTWQLPGLAVKGPWLASGGQILTLAAWAGLKTLLSPIRGFISVRKGCLGSEQVFANRGC